MCQSNIQMLPNLNLMYSAMIIWYKIDIMLQDTIGYVMDLVLAICKIR